MIYSLLRSMYLNKAIKISSLSSYFSLYKLKKESNGFSVALFFYLYATKPATPLTKIYSVFVVFKLCRHWWR